MREGENFGVVDLFDQRHSQKVLRLFGEAYGALPDTQIASEQEQFVEQSVQGLADDKGRVICVRLALYAEMVKDKTWVPFNATETVGGAEGVGITFLEETLSAETAKPTHRRHQKAGPASIEGATAALGGRQYQGQHAQLSGVTGGLGMRATRRLRRRDHHAGPGTATDYTHGS